MNLFPLGSRVLLKRKEVEKIGNIYIPKTSQEGKASIGQVVSVGPDCEFVRVGDYVTFGRYAPLIVLKEELEYYGLPVDLEKDMTYLLCNEADLLCLIADELPERNLPESEEAE